MNSSPRAEDRSEARAILFYTCVAHALTHVYMLLFTPIQEPMRASFGLDRAEFLGYVTISGALFGLGSLPAGWLGDRWGEKRLLVAFFVLCALGAGAIGLAEARWQLALGMALLGLGASIFHPVGNVMIAKGLPRPGRAMGINGLWGSLGTALAPIFAAQATAIAGWRWAYLISGAPALVFAILLVRADLPSVSRPSDTSASADGDRSCEDSKSPGLTASAGRRSSPRGRWVLALILAAMTAGGVCFHLFTTQLPNHVEARLATFSGGAREWLAPLFSDPVLGAGYFVGLALAIGGVGQLVAGRLVDRTDGRRLYVVVLAIVVPLLLLIGPAVGWQLVAVSAVACGFLFAVQPIENILLAQSSPPGRRGLIFGTKFVLVFGVGGLGTYGSGLLRDHFGLPAVFTAAALLVAVAVACAALAAIVGARVRAS